jgi:hypothetical protein
MPTAWESHKVQVLRHAADTGIVNPGMQYLVTEDDAGVARDYSMTLTYEEFLDWQEALRYQSQQLDERRRQAMEHVTRTVTGLLAVEPPAGRSQVDLVIDAKELAALPFEAAQATDDTPLMIDRRPEVVLTRRTTGRFREHAAQWPATPHVLLVASAPDQAVPLDAHRDALHAALKPWIEPLEGVPEAMPDPRRVIKVLEDASLAKVAAACAAAKPPFTHVHLLAHGSEVRRGLRLEFGLRLFADDRNGSTDVRAEDFAAALTAGNRAPSVVTLTACDSGNVGATGVSSSSVAHAVHAAGIPVVLGSQFPLTADGSSMVTETFYRSHFAGHDIRDSLHRTRAVLWAARDRTLHDWMSLVAYVRLPEGYAEHLPDVRLKAELASLETANVWAEHLATHSAPASAYDRVVERLTERIGWLRGWAQEAEAANHRAALDESLGLLGSAHKRLAEVLFMRAALESNGSASLAESRAALHESSACYTRAFAANLSAHWHGVQQLSLEAVVRAQVAEPWRWHAALGAAVTACQDPTEIWACGSRAELHLLAPYAGQPRQLDEGVRAIRDLVERMEPSDPFPLESTLRQLRRYTTWWTAANGYFPGTSDLAEDAQQLIDAARTAPVAAASSN